MLFDLGGTGRLNIGVDMAVGKKQVQTTQVARIEEAGAEAEIGEGGCDEANLDADIRKVLAAFVAIQGIALSGEGRHHHVQIAVLIVIADCDPHIRHRVRLASTEGDAFLQRHILERAVALIAIQIVRPDVIGDEEIQAALSMKVCRRDSPDYGASPCRYRLCG